MYYWAPADSKTEVDFLLVKDDLKVAIEAKSSEYLTKDDYKGLRAVTDLKGLKRRIIVYSGSTKRVTEDGIEVLPVNEFIARLNAGLF
jgi:predicted AAA+ superfamily ATPase